MNDVGRLETLLQRIDGRGYRAYRDIEGRWALDGCVLHVDRVQGDPFAAPSRLRVEVDAERAGFPAWTTSTEARRVALCDYLTRAFHAAIGQVSGPRRGSGKSGVIGIERPGQEVLARTSVVLTDAGVQARFVLGLPAQGRSVMGREAAALLLDDVPDIVEAALVFEALDADRLRRHQDAVEDQWHLRAALAPRGLVAFVGDGAVLPRRSGVDPRPMQGEVVAFEAPEALAVHIEVPHAGRVRGMGVPEGVTLIVGGGYHGKSTLLRAIELGVWDHPPGDGRERVVTRADTVKIRAEDGRRVESVDISPFIDNLPFGRDTRAFCTEDASGSTSQAAAIIEALEAGAGALLMDEDTSATNFMIRDHRMQALVAKEGEPITPFIDKVRQLHAERGVSTVLVVGGAGDYFDVADTVLLMRDYLPEDATERARAIARRFAGQRTSEGGERFGPAGARVPDPHSLDPSHGRRDVKLKADGVEGIRFGGLDIDLGAVEQLVSTAQTRMVAEALVWLKQHALGGEVTVAEALDRLDAALAAEGLDLLARGREGGLAAARRFEVAAALSRLRSLRCRARPAPVQSP